MPQDYRQASEQGQLLEARQKIEVVVQHRFPALHSLVKAQIAGMRELAKLQEILLNVSTAQTMKEISKYLLTLSPPGGKIQT
jgi:hypothetical protein